MISQKSTKVNPRVRVRFRLVFNKKAALTRTIPLLLVLVRPPATTPPNCPCQTPQPENAEVRVIKPNNSQ